MVVLQDPSHEFDLYADEELKTYIGKTASGFLGSELLKYSMQYKFLNWYKCLATARCVSFMLDSTMRSVLTV